MVGASLRKNRPATRLQAFGRTRVRCIRHNMENHAAGIKTNDGVGVSSKIVEEMVRGLACNNSRFCLIVEKLVKSGKNGGIECTSIVEESTRDALDAQRADFVKQGRLIGGGILNFAAVNGS